MGSRRVRHNLTTKQQQGSGCKVMYQDMNKSIEHNLGNFQDLTENNVTENDNPWSYFTLWLPDITWLNQIFALGILLIMHIAL